MLIFLLKLWLLAFFLVTSLVMGILFRFRKVPAFLITPVSQLTLILTITGSFLASAYLSILLEHSLSVLFPMFLSLDIFGSILAVIALTTFIFLFIQARKTISLEKMTVKQAQKKFFERNPIFVFAMYHYSFSIIIFAFSDGFLRFPWFLGSLGSFSINSSINSLWEFFEQLIIFVITLLLPLLLIFFTPLCLKKLLAKVKIKYKKGE